jgi:alkaline phosphatase
MENLQSLGDKLRNVSAKIILAGMIFLLAMAFSVQAADYKLAEGNAGDLSFYKIAPQDGAVRQISGQEVRNIILCIGDGMGWNEVALARHKIVGQQGRLWMETLPVSGSVRTFSADNEVTDSAAAATAMACGVKTNNGVLGIGADKKTYTSILEALSKKGWRTGLVVTSTITHATPAGFASHVSSRGSEEEIAEQMFNDHVDILFGGGQRFWLPLGVKGGVRKDGQNLITMAQQAGYHIAQNRQEMMDLTYGPSLGLLADGAMTTFEPEPMLSEMAQKAIGLLNAKSKDWFAPQPKFFLMIEGSQIDWAGHANDTDHSIRQTLLFDMAVKEALDFARQDRQTLVIVTADHETGGLLLTKDKDNPRKIFADWKVKDHTGADVPLFAFGPQADEFAGVQDNTDIAKKIAKLTKVSPFPQAMETVLGRHGEKTEAVAVPGK